MFPARSAHSASPTPSGPIRDCGIIEVVEQLAVDLLDFGRSKCAGARPNVERSNPRPALPAWPSPRPAATFQGEARRLLSAIGSIPAAKLIDSAGAQALRQFALGSDKQRLVREGGRRRSERFEHLDLDRAVGDVVTPRRMCHLEVDVVDYAQ